METDSISFEAERHGRQTHNESIQDSEESIFSSWTPEGLNYGELQRRLSPHSRKAQQNSPVRFSHGAQPLFGHSPPSWTNQKNLDYWSDLGFKSVKVV
jgi:hypothetical protein